MIALPAIALAVFQCPDGTPPPCAGARAPLPAVVVASFTTLPPDSAGTYVAAALTEDVTAALTATHALHLVRQGSPRAGPAYVLTGTVLSLASIRRVSARLLHGDTIVWTTVLDASAGRGATAADTLAARVLARLGVRSRARRREMRSADPALYELYLRGRYYALRRNTADIARGMRLLQQVVAADSTYAPAWVAIVTVLYYAQAWHLPVPGVPPDSIRNYELAASDRALLSDSGDAEIWIARAIALRDLDPSSREAPLRALRHAIALDSLNASAWADLGYYELEAGDTASALPAFRRSLELDPSNTDARINGSLLFYWSRQYDSAAVWAESLVVVDPTYISGRRLMATVALAKGQLGEAEAQFTAARTIGPGIERVWSLAGLACVAAARHDTSRARALIRETESLIDPAAPNLHGAVFVAWAYTALGEHARALDWLERFHPSGDLHFQRHLLDQPFDPLRDEPRFAALSSR